MVSGGKGNGGVVLDSVELLNMDGTWNCPMPTLPQPRYGHTQTGPVTCGGKEEPARTSCLTFTSGGSDWVKTHKLTGKGRWEHFSWASPRGVMLMGGFARSSGTTTDILTEDGDTIPGFTLDYRIRCVAFIQTR